MIIFYHVIKYEHVYQKEVVLAFLHRLFLVL